MLELPGYRPDQLIHESTRTSIYRGRRNDDGKRVIIKTSVSEYPDVRDLLRFKREFELGSRFSHPRIIKYLDLVKFSGGLALIEEDVNGQSLEGLIPRSGFDIEKFLHIALQFAQGLEEIHRQKVIHLDIKPSNAIINFINYELFLIDFGVAATLSVDLEGGGLPERLEGTLYYMSPEQTGRMNRPVDYRSDIYSLGATFFHLLTGNPPFAEKVREPIELVYCHIARDFPLPGEFRNDIPDMLDLIIRRLTAKEVDARYQSARALRIDLQKCLADYLNTGKITEFIPGVFDSAGTFRIPAKLFGRKEERKIFLEALDALDDSSKESNQTFLVRGFPGVGKTSLVEDLRGPVAIRRGIFLGGRFGAGRRHIPYGGFLDALEEFCDFLLAETEEKLLEWRKILLATGGENIRILCDYAPDLEKIIGPSKDSNKTDSNQNAVRFRDAIRNFILSLKHASCVVMFLDDLQWADSGSLKLITELFQNDLPAGMILVGAFQDGDRNSQNSFENTMNAPPEEWSAREIHLKNLTRKDLGRLVAGSLTVDVEECEPLADLIYKKTAGNAFFSVEFIKDLYEDGFLTYEYPRDDDRGTWSWDPRRIENRSLSGNVVNMILEKSGEESLLMREILSAAACIGFVFEVKLLANILDFSQLEIIRNIWPALEKGILKSLDTNLQNPSSFDAEELERLNIRVRFQHKRVWRTVYELVPQEQRAKRHLEIGRLLKGEPGALFHLNKARVLLVGEEERLELSEMNLKAGIDARESFSFEQARDYFRIGLELLGFEEFEKVSSSLSEGAKPQEPESLEKRRRKRKLKLNLAELELLSGNFEASENLLRGLFNDSEYRMEPEERMQAWELNVKLALTKGDLPRAINLGLEALAELGIHVKSDPDLEEAHRDIERVHDVYNSIDVERLLDRPRIKDPGILSILSVLNVILYPANFISESLRLTILAQMMKLGLEHGNSPHVAVALVSFGAYVLGPLYEDSEGAWRLGKIACDLVIRNNYLSVYPRVFVTHGEMISFRTRPLRESENYLKRSLEIARRNGDVIHKGFCVAHLTNWELATGKTLDEIKYSIGERRKIMTQFQFPTVDNILLGAQGFIAHLKGKTKERSSYYSDDFNESEIEEKIKSGMPFARFLWHFRRMMSFYIFGFLGHAKFEAEQALELRWSSGGAHLEDVEFEYYYALLLASLYNHMPARSRSSTLEELRGVCAKFGEYRSKSPENFTGKYKLIKAEIARIHEEDGAAIPGYEEAIKSARQNDFTHDEAIACELAGNFYRRRGVEIAAGAYLRRAAAAYGIWGATGKVEQLEEKYPGFLRAAVQERSSTTFSDTSAAPSGRLDFETVIKASQAISGEIELEGLLLRLMGIVLENAGARKGAFIMETGGGLEIKTLTTINGRESSQGERLSGSSLVPEGVVNTVWRNGINLVINNVPEESQFGNDDYFTSNHPLSILCMPVIRQGRKLGVLYLENDLTRDAFTEARTKVLNTLLAQAAISLEISGLYQKMAALNQNLENEVAVRKQAEERVLRMNEELEERVELRTHELQRANEELEAFSYSVSHDLRNPLTGIFGFAQILREESAENLGAEGLETLEYIITNCRRMQELIDDLLNMAHVSHRSLSVEDVNLSRVARRIQSYLMIEYPEREVDFIIQKGIERRGDEGLLTIVLENLLNNAWKYSSKNPPERRPARVEFGERMIDAEMVLFVRDNGAGFHMSQVDQLFGVFQRLHDDEEFEGTGLGLATVRRIIERHGGRIWAQSEVGKGATFYFTLEVY